MLFLSCHSRPLPPFIAIPRSQLQDVLSPWHALDSDLAQLPRVRLSASEFDPLLDDSVFFAKRLRALGVDVRLRVAEVLYNMCLLLSVVYSWASVLTARLTAKVREALE